MSDKELAVLRKYVIRSLVFDESKRWKDGPCNFELLKIVSSLSTLDFKDPFKYDESFIFCVYIITGHEDLFPVNEPLYRFLKYYTNRFFGLGVAILRSCSETLLDTLIDIGFIDKYKINIDYTENYNMLSLTLLRKGIIISVYSYDSYYDISSLYRYILRNMITF